MSLAWREFIRSKRIAAPGIGGALVSTFWIQIALAGSGPLLARSLGPHARGEFALLLLIPIVLSHIIALGVPSALAFFSAHSGGVARAVNLRVARLASLQLSLALLVHLVVASAIVTRDRALLSVALLTLPLAPLHIIHSYALAILQASHLFVSFNTLSALPATLYAAAVGLLFVANQGSMLAFAAAWLGPTLFVSSLSVVIAIRVTLRLPPTDVDDVAVPTTGQILRFGGKGLVGAFSPLETLRLDQLVVALFLSASGLGYYVVAASIAGFPRLLAQSLGFIVYPRVAALRRDGTNSSPWGVALPYVAATLVVSGGLIALLQVVLPWLVPLLFGSAFAPAVTPARILVVAAAPLATRRVISEIARGMGLASFGSIGEAVTTGLLLMLLPLAALSGGLIAIAWASLAGACAGLIVLLGLMKRAGRLREDTPQTTIPATWTLAQGRNEVTS